MREFAPGLRQNLPVLLRFCAPRVSAGGTCAQSAHGDGGALRSLDLPAPKRPYALLVAGGRGRRQTEPCRAPRGGLTVGAAPARGGGRRGAAIELAVLP